MDISVDLEIVPNIFSNEMLTEEKKEIHSRNVGFTNRIWATDTSIMVLSFLKEKEKEEKMLSQFV